MFASLLASSDFVCKKCADGLGTGSKWDGYWSDSGLAEGRKSEASVV